ncbi:hypothetical protein [Polyangium sp. 15x6]|uniref:hypothetical protein n=1 Tax=Polyangium sp. 15x6 TaxID=3042687 RepID=UPI00249B989C|nr:hypothetical protein [Polyangium sp. 15x6]MDI3287833.1 hypothetical protein [Polyangium sp. 15x6]
MALHASAADPPAPADAEPRKHSLSVTAGLTPFYLSDAVGYDGLNAFSLSAPKPLLEGLSGDYMRSFGLVRVGVGLRYTYTQDTRPRGFKPWKTFAHELGISGLLGLGGTTRSGVDIAATFGLGIGHCWMPSFDSYAPRWGVTGELLVSVAIPVTEASDIFLRSGSSIAYFIGNAPEVPEGYWPPDEPYLVRAYIPIELGYRRRF